MSKDEGKDKLLDYYNQLDAPRKRFAEKFLEFLASDQEMSSFRSAMLSGGGLKGLDRKDDV